MSVGRGRESLALSQDTHKISAGRLPSSCPSPRRFPRIRFLPRQFLPRIYAPTGALLFSSLFFRQSSPFSSCVPGATNPQRPFSHLPLTPRYSHPIPPIPGTVLLPVTSGDACNLRITAWNCQCARDRELIAAVARNQRYITFYLTLLPCCTAAR